MNGNNSDREEKRLSIINRVIAVLVILFFTAIILFFYRLLYIEKRNNIFKNGEITAKESVDQIDQYLSTNIDSVNLAAYTLDSMIMEGRSDDEIQSYLVDQSTAVRSAVLENSTGLYAYVNGRFFSGTNWTPPEGYDATARPWYIRPLENPGELTILEPYMDIQSGNVMLALGKSLCDGVSVVSVDVSLDMIQKLTVEAVSSGNTDMEMIIDNNGVVIAHSDVTEIGNDYSSEQENFGSKIVDMLGKAKSKSFELYDRGSVFLVYAADMQNGWHCISVKNATGVYDSLRKILLLTVSVVVLMVLIISIMLNRTNRWLRLSTSAKAESEAKSAFLSKMSHEIRTPINAMLGMNEMILRESKDEVILGYAHKAKTAGKSLLSMVNSILDFSTNDDQKSEVVLDEEELYIDRISGDKQYHVSFTAPDAHVLVVDDNSINLMVFESLIKETGIQTDAAGSGDEGIRFALETKYDIIFLDHMMPYKDGIQTLHEIRHDTEGLNYSTPVICLTANAVSGAREQYLAQGFDNYLTKPIDPQELEEMMLTYISPEKTSINYSYDTDDSGEEVAEGALEQLKVLQDSPIDSARGLKNSGTVDSYLALLKVFYDSIDEKYSELDEFYRQKDYENYTIKVHALKSSARIIGAIDLGEQAQELENAGKSGDIEYIESHHEKLLKDYSELKELLNEMSMEYEPDADKPEADADLMVEVFGEIRSAAEDMDCERLDAIFGEMSEYRIPKADKDLYEKLYDASQKYEYRTILTLMEQEWFR